MYGDVNAQIQDGGLGAVGNTGSGAHVKIGVSPIESASPIVITSSMNAKKIRALLGHSPLADACMDSVSAGAGQMYCIPVKASTDGTIGSVTKDGEGLEDMTVSEKPYSNYSVEVLIVVSGGFNEAAFKYSLDGGYSYSDEVTIPVDGNYIISDTGLKLKFTENATKADSYKVGDKFTFSTTAPQMTNQDVLTAVEKMKGMTQEFEGVHIVGPSTKALWAAMEVEASKFATTYQMPLWFLFEFRDINDGEALADYATALLDERKGLTSFYIQVAAARALFTKMDGRATNVNGAAIVTGLYARASVQESIGKVRDYPISGVLKLLPEGIEDYIKDLDAAGYITFRQYQGIEGFYVTSARTMAPDTSDYKYAERVRVANKLIRVCRTEALMLLQEDIDMSDPDGSFLSMAAFIQSPADQMVKQKEISSVTVTVPEGQDVLATEQLTFVIRFVPIGQARAITLDVGMTNPLA
jgi:hypothetical protein